MISLSPAVDESMMESQAGPSTQGPSTATNPLPPTNSGPADTFQEVSNQIVDPQFQAAQQTDVTLQGLQALVAIRKGQVIDAQRAG